MLNQKKGVNGALAVLLLVWSFPPIIIKYLDYYFPPQAQNFYRYLGAAIFLIFFSFFIFRREIKICIKKFKYFILPACLLSVFQTIFVYGISFSQANTASFLSKLGVAFVVLVAWMILPEERKIIKKAGFVTGFSLTFAGATVITLGKENITFSLGSFLIIISNFFWALYTIQMKKLLKEIKITPSLAMGFVTIIASGFLFFPALPYLHKIIQTPPLVNLILFLSGSFLVGAGGALYYFLLKKIGATLTNNAMLLTSFVSAFFSFLLLGEKMTLWQVVGGIILIPGCYIILRQTEVPGGKIQT